MYIQYLRQGNHHTYGHIRCVYTVLANPIDSAPLYSMVTMVTMGGDLQPGCLADRLLTGLGQPQINP